MALGVGSPVYVADMEDAVGTVGTVSTAWGLVQGCNRPSTLALGLLGLGPGAAGRFLGGIRLRGVLVRGELPGVGRRWVCPRRIRCSRPVPSRRGRFSKCQVVPWHPLRPRSEPRVWEWGRLQEDIS